MSKEQRNEQELNTYFAPAERESVSTLRRQAGLFSSERVMRNVTDAIAGPLLILNSQRQLVFANQATLELVGVHVLNDVLGMRPGELLNCRHAEEMPAGCGTSEFCSVCGAAEVILSGLRGREKVQECRITTRDQGAWDLQVSGKPLQVAGEHFTVFSIRDISHEKRRRMLERLFFHDVLNTAGGLRGMSEILEHMKDEEEFTRTKQLIRGLADELIEEIEAQRDLSAAENSELKVHPQQVNTAELVEQLAVSYRTHGIAKHQTIHPDLPHSLPLIESDPRLLRRILGNMLKNALEANPSGGNVSIAAAQRSLNGRNGIEFSVHNAGCMSKKVQMQVFQRSFSTKAGDRGLGTYSMRLLGEHYLGGQVSFTSEEEEGTIFYAWIPEQYPWVPEQYPWIPEQGETQAFAPEEPAIQNANVHGNSSQGNKPAGTSEGSSGGPLK